MKHWIWITWEKHRRTRELSYDLRIRLFEKSLDLSRLIKHPYLLLWTCRLLARLKPKGVIVQNPSILLALCVTVLKSRFRYALVVDAHNSGLRPTYRILRPFEFIFRYIQAKADLTIVTNNALAEMVKTNSGRPFVLPDRLPRFPAVGPTKLRGKYNIVCVSTFARDEPIGQVLQAAQSLGGEYSIYVTGNYHRLRLRSWDTLPGNVVFTGYLPDTDYVALLKSADVVLDLTSNDNCLVCGAYEAVALERPLILSDTTTLRTYFHKGAVYTKNNPADIKSAVLRAIATLPNLRSEIIALKTQLSQEGQTKRAHLIEEMNALLPRALVMKQDDQNRVRSRLGRDARRLGN